MEFLRYRRTCQTEGALVTVIRMGTEGEPAQCPNGAAHVLGADPWVVIEQWTAGVPVNPDNGMALVDNGQHPHGWLYSLGGETYQVPANTSPQAPHTHDFVFLNDSTPPQPTDVWLWSADLDIIGGRPGDRFDVIVLTPISPDPYFKHIRGLEIARADEHVRFPSIDRGYMFPAYATLRAIYTPVDANGGAVTIRAMLHHFRPPVGA